MYETAIFVSVLGKE